MRRIFWLASLVLALQARAEDRLHVDVHGSGGRDYQVAVQRFSAGEGALEFPGPFYEELTQGLAFSSVFKVVDPEAFLEPRETRDFEARVIPCDNWRAIGADALVQGRLERERGRLRARFQVWDVLRCRRQGDRQYFEDAPEALRALARRVADEIVYRFSGRRGVSATQIAFISDRAGNKEVYVMEADGSNRRRVTGNGSVNLFPGWSADGATLVYTSLRKGRFDLLTLARGRRPAGPLLTAPDQKYRGVWHPRDGTLALTMHRDGNTDLYTVRKNGRKLRRLTTSRAIENSPTWAPDGKQIAFVSDRSGSPQLYVKDLKSGEERRLTYRGSYNATPAWSPNGNWIVFSALTGSNFDLYLIDPETGYTTPLVVHPRGDEDPAWSPDGRKIVFSSSRRGRKELYQIDLDGRNLRRVTSGFGNCTNPAWSPWLD